MKISLYLFVFILSLNSFGQKQLGQWSEYLSYNSVNEVVEGKEVIFAACQNSIFSYDRSDNSINRYSSVNGLSDKHITSIAWNDNNNALLIGYENGNIDFLFDNEIYNFSDIKRSPITSDKQINSFFNEGDLVWVSTGFGIVKINVVAREVVDTYIIGENGSEARVNNVAHHEGDVFASTENGIFRADLNTALPDYNNWFLVNELPVSNYERVFSLDGSLCAFLNEETSKQVYKKEDGNWLLEIDDQTIRNVYTSNNHLLILRFDWVRVRNSDFNVVIDVADYDFTDREEIIYGYMDAEGKIWLGDNRWGLIEHIEENIVNNYQPDGPNNNTAWQVDAVDDEMWIAHGGVSVQFASSYKKTYFSGITNSSWQQFAEDGELSNNDVFDIIDVAINPINTSQVYFASWDGGLIEKKPDGSLEVYRNNLGNSDIQTFGSDSIYRVGGIDFDTQGNLWITNATENANEHQLLVKKVNGDEVVLDCQGLGYAGLIGGVIHTSNNQIWALNNGSQDGRLFVYDYNGTIDNTNDDQCMKINTNTANGGLPTNNVLSVAEDLDGEIWLGTNEGPAVIYTPEFLFENNPPQAQQIKVEQDGNVEIVLSTSSISTIAIDGANRKWLGTTNSGAFLLSEDGTETILHFTTENSPLLENSIRHITINDKSGEVFFATDEGLFSYVGDATLGERSNECFNVFPNPVQPDYHGPISIDGLARDSQVKITDISGNLVYETVSSGGRAIWDANNFSGQRVQSGVYLALITSIENDIETSCIAKIMIIN